MPAPPAPSRRPALIITAVVAVIVGLVLGGGIGYLIFADRGDSGSTPRAEQDVAEGCAILERLAGELPVDPDSASLKDPVIFELLGAGHLFMAASRADESYEAISELGNDLINGMSRLDLDQANEAIAPLQEECADR